MNSESVPACAPLTILIVDDEVLARERLLNLLEDIAPVCPTQCLVHVGSAQAALDCLMQQAVDVLLLDVQMPGMTGIEFAQHLLDLHASQHLAKIPAIIFVTAYDEYALQAFEVHAFDYLLKPVRATRLQDTLVRMQLARNVNHGAQLREALASMPRERLSFSVTERNRVILVPVNEVLFLKAELKYVTIQTKNHAYLTEESLVSIEQEMSRYFVRVHRNALVARSAIIGIERASIQDEHEDSSEPKNGEQKLAETWQVILQDSPERLVISRRQLAVIKALLK